MNNRPRPDIVRALTIAEKAALTSGESMWFMQGIERLGVPGLKVTDGPNGARGAGIFGLGKTSACFPCGSALGATWNPALVERIGVALGQESKTKSCSVLLAPTVNLHRSPLYGRNFECYSEDPFLSARMAVAYIRGVQSERVACVIKHFVGNDAEFERMTINSVIDERTLRELYLPPFEAAVKEAGVWGVMTAYNRLNGTFCTANGWLLRDLLREEWGFDGIVMTDWFSAVDTVESSKAGLDVEMPGPPRFFGPALAAAVDTGDVDPGLVDAQAARILQLIERVGGLEGPIVDHESEVDLPEHRQIIRRAATEAIVLLKNDGDLLPLASGKKVALIGHNAGRLQLYGGGSAQLQPHYRIDLPDSLRAALGPGSTVEYSPGVWVGKFLSTIEAPNLQSPDGGAGMRVEYLDADGAVNRTETVSRSEFLDFAPNPNGSLIRARASAIFNADIAGIYQLSLYQVGKTRVSVDGKVVIDGIDAPLPPGESYFGFGSIEAIEDLVLSAGQHQIHIDYLGEGAPMFRAARVGLRPPLPADMLEAAVKSARAADIAIVVVGNNEDFESEGVDRPDMNLPCGQDELILRVAQANPNTVVVINAASPVTMDWDASVPAILQCWFGGQELANALADVISGAVNPSGRLPTTIPLRIEHSPSFGNFPGESGEIRYGEGLLMGYRHFDTRQLPARYHFGHGLSYTTFQIGNPGICSQRPGGCLRVEVDVTNSGDRRGAQVIQAYVEPPAGPVFRPRRELGAFARIELGPGETGAVELEFNDRSFSFWDPGTRGWTLHCGQHQIHIGSAIDSIARSISVQIDSN